MAFFPDEAAYVPILERLRWGDEYVFLGVG